MLSTDELAPRFPTSVLVTSITSSSASIQWMLTDPYSMDQLHSQRQEWEGLLRQENMQWWLPQVTCEPVLL